MSELLEWNPVGETLSADPDTFQNTVASQLIEHKRRVNFASAFFVIGNDAPDEVRVGVSERDHELGQLFLVELRNRAEHALASARAKLSVGEGLLGHPDDLRVLPDVTHEGILRGLQETHDVLVQWVHVLHQPLVGAVINLAGVVNDGKIG